jgi:DHA2 family multidrug resistance protein
MVIQREYKIQSGRSFDIVGFLAVVLFLAPLLIALSDGIASWNTGGWTSPFILTCFALSLIGLVIFLSVEFNVRDPLIELRLLKNFNFGMSNLVLFIFGMGMFGSTFLLPLYLQNGLGYTAFQAGSLFLPLGLIMAVMGPISGVLSDKINPKIIAVMGIALLALSLFVNYYLSLFSMTSDIMVSLYLRGFGMALIFTPLNTLALSDVPRDRMAQASGLFNVIRQIGGSFGVAIMGTLLTDRTIFHNTVYGQAVSESSPVTQNVLLGLQSFAQRVLGSTVSLASMRANALLVYNISQQAFVSAVDDDFLVAAMITIVCVVPILFLRYKKRVGEKVKVVAMD